MNPITVEAASKRFGELQALRDISFQLRPGSALGLFGPNGAGKSTLLKLLAGLWAPSSGTVRVLGDAASHRNPARWQRLGYVPQNRQLPEWMNGQECLEYAAALRPKWDAEAVAKLVQRLEVPLRQPVGQLSRGHYVRLQCCLALGHHPQLLLLDEPLAGMDVRGRQELLGALIAEMADQGMTLVISSHVAAELQRLTDVAAVLEAGRLVAYGAAEEVLEESHSAVAAEAEGRQTSSEFFERLNRDRSRSNSGGAFR